MTDGHYNYKMIFVNINESQKARLEDFFDEIKFYYYTVQKKIESVWDAKVKHKDTLTWPGTDCTFILTVPERNLDKMLKNLKHVWILIVWCNERLMGLWSAKLQVRHKSMI